MTYSLIPPILVVLSIIGIIFFLLKKAPQVASLEDNSEEITGQNNLDRPKLGTGRGERMKQSFLIILEKTTRRFRLLILKLDSLFTSWNTSIRRKRQDRMNQFKQNNEKESSNVLDNVRNYGLNNIKPEKERVPRPMLSQKVVSSQNKVELKDRLEKILIDRIASNPKDIEAYERLGEYYLEINNLSYAKECFKQVIKLDPTNASARSKMRKLGRILGR